MNRAFVCLVGVFLSFLSAADAQNDFTSIDSIVAVVNNEVIAQSDVDRVMSTIEAEYASIYTDPKELAEQLAGIEKNIVNQMIEEKLIISEAKKLEINVEEEVIDSRINQIKADFPNDETFELALEMQGLTLEDLRSRFYDQEIMRKAVDAFVHSQIKTDPSTLQQFYEEHQDEFIQPEKAKVKAIFVKIDEAQDETKAQEIAQMILERLKQGEVFADLSRTYSQGANAEEGGDLGYVEKGKLMKELDEAIFNTNVGGYTGILRTSTGLRIFLVEERTAGKKLTFSEAHDLVKDTVQKREFSTKFREFISRLKENADIVIK
ncbi:MAG: peptidylprolyl isomerase [Candidatus Omnitrophota bacterium]